MVWALQRVLLGAFGALLVKRVQQPSNRHNPMMIFHTVLLLPFHFWGINSLFAMVTSHTERWGHSFWATRELKHA